MRYCFSRKIFMLVGLFVPTLFSDCFANGLDGHTLSYSINYAPESDYRCLNIRAEIMGAKSGEYLLRVPAETREFRMSSPQMISYKNTDHPLEYRVSHAPFAPTYFEYQCCPQQPTGEVEFPIIEKDFIHLLVENVLVTPVDELNHRYKINVKLEGFPQEHKFVTSFNLDQRSYQLVDTITHFRSSIIAGGNIQLKTIYVNQQPIHIVSNTEWPFAKMPDFYIQKLVEAQRNFWNDNDFPFYVIYLLKSPDIVDDHFVTAKHWYQSISIFLPKAKDKLAFNTMMYVFSHELSHAWIGWKINSPIGFDSIWFLEGFNDFYGFYFAVKTGLINFRDSLKVYNYLIKNYYLSPLRELPTSEALTSQIFPFDYRQQWMFRGHFTAKANHFKNKKTFEAGMRAVLSHYHQGEKRLALDELDALFDHHLGSEQREQIRKSVDSGDLITFVPDLFAPFAKLVETEMEVPTFGFNIKEAAIQHVIKDVVPGSKDYLAGLRNDQQVLRYDPNFFNAANKKVSITVRDLGEIKRIEYIPATTWKKIPQYQIARSGKNN